MTFFTCGLKPGTRNPVTPSEPSRKTTLVKTVGSVVRWVVGLPVQQLENRRFCDWKTAVHLTVAVKIDWSWDCILTYDIQQLFMMSLELSRVDMFLNSFRPLVSTSKWPCALYRVHINVDGPKQRRWAVKKLDGLKGLEVDGLKGLKMDGPKNQECTGQNWTVFRHQSERSYRMKVDGLKEWTLIW